MFEQMKEAISKGIKELHVAGKSDTQAIEETVKKAVAQSMQTFKEDNKHVREIAKEAVTSAVAILKETGIKTRNNVSAVVDGVIEGIGQPNREMMQTLDMEMLKTKYLFQEKRGELAESLQEALDGAKEASATFTSETKDTIDASVAEIKLKSAELLGLMEEMVRQSVQTTISEGENIKSRIAAITKKTLENALDIERVSAQRVKVLSETILLTTIKTAEATEKNITEVTEGAIKGTREGVITAIEKMRSKTIESENKIINYAKNDLKQTLEDLEKIDEAYIEAINNTANKVDVVAQEVLLISLDEMKRHVSQIKVIIDEVTSYMREEGVEAASNARNKVLDAIETAKSVKQEASELADTMMKIAKGAFTGMIDGAKKAIEDTKETEK